MRRNWLAAGLVGGIVSVAQAGAPAGTPDVAGIAVIEPVVLQAPDAPKGKDGPPAKDVPPKKDAPPAKKDEPAELARTDPAAEAAPGYFSRMLGDSLGGGYATRYIALPGSVFLSRLTFTTLQTHIEGNSSGKAGEFEITTPVPNGTVKLTIPTVVVTQAQVPIVSRGGFKIAENEMPFPEDRFFLTYNGFDGVTGAVPPLPSTATTGTYPAATEVFKPARRVLAPVAGGAAVVPGFGAGPATLTTLVSTPATTVHQEAIGFEKTFLDGLASVGVRAPFFQVRGDGTVTADDFGDMTVVFKYLAAGDRETGLSVGLAVTLPTGPPVPTLEGNIHSTLWQPFVGGRVTAGDFFANVFTSVLLPGDSRDTKAWFNDLQVGAVVYRGQPTDFISSLAPVSEVHVTTPLQSKLRLVYVPDLVALTEGLQVGIGPATVLNLALVIPVTGPRPFEWEGVVQMNFRY
jgi:hypothetical protein